MTEWWNGLTTLEQAFFAGAIFFSVFFVWQFVSAIAGLGGGDTGLDHGGMDHGADAHGDSGEAHATAEAFELLSVRSVLAFFTLFTWAGGLYLRTGTALTWALCYAIAWGLAGMFAVALVLKALKSMTEHGNMRIDTAVGTDVVVYLNIPAGGHGEVRATVGGVVTTLRARGAGGAALAAGTRAKVLRVIEGNCLEVAPLD